MFFDRLMHTIRLWNVMTIHEQVRKCNEYSGPFRSLRPHLPS